MGSQNTAWDTADAWTFAFVVGVGGRFPLAQLLRAADRSNPFVLADGQLEFTLGKLVGSGLVRIYDGWDLEATDEGLSLLEDVSFADPERLQIACKQLALVDPTPTKVKLPKGVLDAAEGESHS